MLALGVVVHHHTIPIAWKVVRGNTKGAWLPMCEAMRALLRGALPKSMPVYGLTDWGLWSPELFGVIVRNGWHPLMRINAQGNFRPLWGRRARALVALCPARAGQQVVIAGEAFRYRLRCRLVVFWGAGAQDVWYLLTDLPARAVCGSWYGYRMWIEQGFRWHGAWVFWVALVSCGFGGGYGLGVVGVCVGVRGWFMGQDPVRIACFANDSHAENIPEFFELLVGRGLGASKLFAG